MKQTLAIARRDLLAYFLSPIGYIVVGLFLVLSGFFFTIAFQSGELTSLRLVFDYGGWALLLVAPAISMRSFSDEFRLGSFETLATSPVSDGQIVSGKFIACMGVLLALLIPTLIYVLPLETYSRPDYGEIGAGYLGLLLVGSAYLASGIFVSTFTSNQIVAYLVTLFPWLIFGIGVKYLPLKAPAEWADLLFAVDPSLRLKDFTIGLIDTANIVYFVSIAAVFLIAAVVSLTSRRWR